MTKLSWNDKGDAIYELGVDRGFLFPEGKEGVSWSSLTKIVEKHLGGEPDPIYFDGFKYSNEARSEDLEITIEAYTYPDAFAICNGLTPVYDGLYIGQQDRHPFSFSYRTMVEDDSGGGYKIHFVYDAVALPPNTSRASLSDSPEGLLFSWEVILIPKPIPGFSPTMHISIDSTLVKNANLIEFERLLYGDEGRIDPWLPSPKDILDFFSGDIIAVKIEDSVEEGIHLLGESLTPDLKGMRETGYYWEARLGRLSETDTDGLYELE